MGADMEKWHEEKWDMYEDIATTMAEAHSCEELKLTLVDILEELNQYLVRSASKTGGTLYKHGDTLDLFKYYFKSIIYMMAVSEAMKDHKDIMDMIEKSEVHCFYDEYVKEK